MPLNLFKRNVSNKERRTTMKEEDELLKKCGTKNPFMVPEGYFDNFSKELMNKLPEKEQTSAPQETITTWQRIKPWIYMAAMFCGLMFSVRVVVGPPKQDTPIFTAAETEQFSDEYIETILDHSMMDDYTLYQSLQRLATLLITLYISISLQAQDKKKPGFTKEEFRARQEAYLTQKAEITQEEATKFFPIYFELQDRKKTVNDKAWEQARKGKNPKTTDAEYEQIIEGIVKARIEADKLDLEYLQRFKKILSPKKIYKLQRAEIKFHRDILKIMHQSQKK